ncbi:TPA: phosphoglycerate kinase [Candidatus Uhrbacteria bacterium]|nr:phosphoglycerate kinase [Candidatus Uhrbacteria bacterium]
MRLKSWKASDVKHGTRVLLRIDANVDLVRGRASIGRYDKIAKALPEILRLQARGACIILLTHLGRPRGKQTEFSVTPIAKAMSKALGTKILVSEDVVGKDALRLASTIKPGQIVMLENLRFDKREEANDDTFAELLASMGDVYVNNAFGVCHRAHASVVAITKFLPSFAGGLLVEEVKQLSAPMKKPFVLIVGGNKLETKVPLLSTLGVKADLVIVGSGLLPAFKKGRLSSGAKGVIDLLGDKLRLPVDTRIDRRGSVIDIGRATEQVLPTWLRGAKTIVWNGPVGLVEERAGAAGTKALMKAIVGVHGARSIVGGGSTVALVENSTFASRFTLLSTGGGAMLEFLSGEEMPGLKGLEG